MSEMVYEKHYPHKTFEEEMQKLEEISSVMQDDEEDKRWVNLPSSFEEFYKDMMENRTLIIIPDKINRAKDFIRLAIRISELYELDTVIRRNDSHISVDYSFDSGGDMMFLLPILREADSISFFSGIGGYEITISIDFYTHAVFLHGRLTHPIDLEL